MAKKSAISGEYIITVEDTDAIRVCRIYDNVTESLREAAAQCDFKYDPKWNTQQFGKKLVDEFGDGKTAEIGEYTISRNDNGHIDSYRVFGNTSAALRGIADLIGFTHDPKWNTRTFGSKLVDFVNCDYNPADTSVVADGLVISPDMTVADLQDKFMKEFGGHLRIKKGAIRCDARKDSSTGKVHEALDSTLAGIGCTGEGVFGGDLTVAEFTEKAKKECGLNLVVATCDDWVAALDGFALDSVRFIPRNTTKIKMQEILSR